MGEPMIERLHLSAKPALLDVFTQAFVEQAFIPSIGRRPGTIRAVMKAFLRFFGRSRSLLLHGIRRDDRLVCGSVSADATEGPTVLAAILFFVELVRALGWRTTTEFGTAKLANDPDDIYAGGTAYTDLELVKSVNCSGSDGCE